MFNKRIIVIIIGILAIVLLVVLIFSFGLKRRSNNTGNEKVPETTTENKNEEIKIEDTISEDKNIISILSDLKRNHPNFSDSQIDFYRETAKHSMNIDAPCLGRSDENECIASVAFIKGEAGICREITDRNKIIGCANDILKMRSEEEVDKCSQLGGNDYVNCLGQIFSFYNRTEDCANLNSEKAEKICQEVFLYKEAFMKRDSKICDEITDDKLKQFCLENKMIKDSDGDGLSDGDEILKYKTDPNNRDTDGDGYSDGDEVKNGYNPLGAGKLQ